MVAWKYWKLDSSIFSYPGNTGGGRAEAGGWLQGLCCAALDYFWNMFPGISWYPGNIGNMCSLYFGIFFKKDARRNFTQNAPVSGPRSLIWDRFRTKTKTVSDLNFQVTAATAAAATATSQQLSHLARALDYHAQGPKIPFGGNPSLRSRWFHLNVEYDIIWTERSQFL